MPASRAVAASTSAETGIGLGVTAAHARPQTLHGALPQAVERQRRAVIARRQNELVTQVEPQPEPRLQLQVSSHATGTQAAVLVGTELEPAPPIRQVDGVNAPPRLHRGFQDHDLQPDPREVARADQSVVPGADDHHVRSGGLSHEPAAAAAVTDRLDPPPIHLTRRRSS